MYPAEIAKDFVREYYSTLLQNSANLPALYTENARVDHSVEGQASELSAARGVKAVSEVMERYTNAKVMLTDVTGVQGGANQVLVVVFGDIASSGETKPRTFTQTLLLTKAKGGKHQVLADVFKILQSESPRLVAKPAHRAKPSVERIEVPKPQRQQRPVAKKKSPPVEAKNGEAKQSPPLNGDAKKPNKKENGRRKGSVGKNDSPENSEDRAASGGPAGRGKETKDKEQNKEKDLKTKDSKDKDSKDKEIKDKESKDKEAKDAKDVKDKDVKDKDVKEKDVKEKDVKEKDVKEKDVKEKDVKEKDAKEKDAKEKDAKEKDAKDSKTKEKSGKAPRDRSRPRGKSDAEADKKPENMPPPENTESKKSPEPKFKFTSDSFAKASKFQPTAQRFKLPQSPQMPVPVPHPAYPFGYQMPFPSHMMGYHPDVMAPPMSASPQIPSPHMASPHMASPHMASPHMQPQNMRFPQRFSNSPQPPHQPPQ